jgi:ketosteroid isomerase-like protein
VDEVRAIEGVLAEYCHRCDEGNFDELVDLFTDDGCFSFGKREATGRAGLLEYFEWAQAAGRRGKHLSSNVVVHVQGETAVAVSDYVFLVRREDTIVPLAAGRYDDDLRKVEGRWRIRRRVTTNL